MQIAREFQQEVGCSAAADVYSSSPVQTQSAPSSSVEALAARAESEFGRASPTNALRSIVSSRQIAVAAQTGLDADVAGRSIPPTLTISSRKIAVTTQTGLDADAGEGSLSLTLPISS